MAVKLGKAGALHRDSLQLHERSGRQAYKGAQCQSSQLCQRSQHSNKQPTPTTVHAASRCQSLRCKAAAFTPPDTGNRYSNSQTTGQYIASGGGKELVDWVWNLPWPRVAIWLTVAAVAAQLNDFFGIAMGTFIVSFIGNGFVKSGQRGVLGKPLASRPVLQRRLLVLLYFTAIVLLVTLFGVMTIPDIIREGADFVQRLQSDNIWVVVLEKMRDGLGDGVMEGIERLLLVATGDELTSSLAHTEPHVHVWTTERTLYLGRVLSRMLRGYTEAAVSFTSNLVSFISRFAVQVGVSLVLSFMIVWDLPRIQRGVATLRTSRLEPIYTEVAPTCAVFGTLFGRALQAQARIALVNTALTAAGMWALQIPGVGLLSLFVFICSFIPIAGVIISTTPVGFVALTEYGFMKLALVVAMVTGVHMVEAYLLNPAIYSAHLKLHPLMVLTVLVFAEHSLGIWGLLLAVPLTVFALDYCIRYPACSIDEVAAKELDKVSMDFSDFSDSDSDGTTEGQDRQTLVRPG